MRIRHVGTTLVAAAFIVWAWEVVDVDWFLALVVQGLGTTWIFFALRSPERLLPDRWWRVHAAEIPWYRGLGARLIDTVLAVLRWNRAVDTGRGFDGTRASLKFLDRGTRRSEVAHLFLLGGSVAFVAIALALGRVELALWSALFAAGFHAYPVMIQRSLRHRIQRLQTRMAQTEDADGPDDS